MSRFCSSCGTGLSPEWNHCPKCGQTNQSQTSPPIADLRITELLPPEPLSRRALLREEQEDEGRRSRIGWILTLCAVAVIILVVHSYTKFFSDARPSNNADSATLAQRIPVPFPHTVQLGPPAMALSAGEYKYIEFTIQPGWTNAMVEGRFQAEGGSGNDVVILILDQDGFTNWQNHHAVPTFYNSGQVTVGDIHAGPLAPGTYYLIFSNTFSFFANKAITADVKLKYLGL